MIMASMRNWLSGEDDDLAKRGRNDTPQDAPSKSEDDKKKDQEKRVVVVHCKAGKGRSGTMTCSYLISQCGWTAEDALARFTQRRMRPSFGAGVSIPSQLRWISYVDRWTKGGKKYVDQEVEILEVHVWGLRHGVKVGVEGFTDEGKKIKTLHTFSKQERYVVQGDAPGGGGMMDFLGDALSPAGDDEEIYEDADYNDIVGDNDSASSSKSSLPARSLSKLKKDKKESPIRNNSVRKLKSGPRSKTINPADYANSSTPSSQPNLAAPNASQPSLSKSSTFADTSEPGGMAVIFKPSEPIILPTSDVKISLERRNRAPASLGLTMVTALAHVWFNTFFEGQGPEQDGHPDDNGVFEIEWEKMDGLKGSSRKGTKAADRISVVWKAAGPKAHKPGVVITEPGEGSPVPQMKPADWKGTDAEDPDQGRRLGLRAEEPGSACVSKASSVKSQEEVGKDGAGGETDEESLNGVKSYGEDEEEEARGRSGVSSTASNDNSEKRTLSEHDKKVEATKGRTEDPDAVASGSANRSHEELVHSSHPGAWGSSANRSSETTSGTAASQPAGNQEEGSGSTFSATEGITATKQRASDGTSTSTQKEKQEDSRDAAGNEDHSSEDKQRSGDTTHLGFVKRGKKLLPMHNKNEEPNVLPAHVQK